MEEKSFTSQIIGLVSLIIILVVVYKFIDSSGITFDKKKDISKQVVVSMQSELDKNPTFSKYQLKVLRVDLVKESSNKYNGFAVVLFKDTEQNVPIEVTYDGDNMMYSTKPFAFSFLAIDALENMKSKLMGQ
jgi:hypothetical protein